MSRNPLKTAPAAVVLDVAGALDINDPPEIKAEAR
jgi:hypothetical protein